MEQKITVPKGCKIESVEHDDNSVIIMFGKDKPKFKKGDFLKANSGTIIIYKDIDPLYTHCCLSFYNNNFPISYGWVMENFHLCTEQEKQDMLEYMHSNGVDWDEKNMEVVPYIWKPKEGEEYWLVAHDGRVLSSDYNSDSYFDLSAVRMNNCFPTKELVMPYAEEFKRILKERKL